MEQLSIFAILVRLRQLVVVCSAIPWSNILKQLQVHVTSTYIALHFGNTRKTVLSFTFLG